MAKITGSGWYLESHRHALASKGIKTGTKSPGFGQAEEKLYWNQFLTRIKKDGADKETLKILNRSDEATKKYHAIFEKYWGGQDYKKPIDILVPSEAEAKELANAIQFFQADIPTITKETIPVRHREGLVYMQMPMWRVQSKGYQAW